ncbi:MAG: ribosome small subunit-dependent GTPase A [Anaerolineae bacterium]|nr:ribosome small subunit-dependent GTPase A [Anaerolineae bacterium]
MELKEGLVIRSHGGHYYVQSPEGEIDCSIRGRLKKRQAESDLVAVGDRVRWSPTEEGAGIIEEVLPRRSVLSRSPPPPRPQVEQVIVANPDQVLVVFSLLNPSPNPLMLDRYLVACEAVELPVIIVWNKTDLVQNTDDVDWEMLERYRQIGYETLFTSAETGEGIEALRDRLRGKLTVLTGPSGVGKSKLLNCLWPDLDLGVGEISEYHDRGRHTTVVARLLNPEPDIYVADTPGLRQFRFWDIDPEQLEAFFPEMRPYLGKCYFTPCTHIHEPECAVREAVERGEIAEMRYESYCKMFEYEF